MSTPQESTLAAAWTASVAQARTSLAAVERGELRASARQIETWQRIVDRAQTWGLA